MTLVTALDTVEWREVVDDEEPPLAELDQLTPHLLTLLQVLSVDPGQSGDLSLTVVGGEDRPHVLFTPRLTAPHPQEVRPPRLTDQEECVLVLVRGELGQEGGVPGGGGVGGAVPGGVYVGPGSVSPEDRSHSLSSPTRVS